MIKISDEVDSAMVRLFFLDNAAWATMTGTIERLQERMKELEDELEKIREEDRWRGRD